MGACISSASSEIHAVQHGHENVVYFENSEYANGSQMGVGSIHSHQGSKGMNQDSAILYQGFGVEYGVLCGVFDGHGSNGQAVSKMVRNRLPSLVLNQMNSMAKILMSSPRHDANEKVDGGDQVQFSKKFTKWKDALVSSFKVMDKELKLLDNMDCLCSGTTAVVVLKQGGYLLVGNLGDSRAILGRSSKDGIVPIQLTTDLKPGLPMESERIRKCNGRVLALKEEPHIDRVWLPNEDSPGLAMSRAFGDFVLKHHGIIAVPEVSYHHISEDDRFLVLASDGVWDVMSNDQVTSIVSSAPTEEAAAKAVVDACLAAWKHKFPNTRRDDCTVVCLFLA